MMQGEIGARLSSDPAVINERRWTSSNIGRELCLWLVVEEDEDEDEEEEKKKKRRSRRRRYLSSGPLL